LDGTGNVTIAAGDVDGGSSDNCSIVLTMSLDISSFDCSNIGPNTVVLTVEDECGNQSTCNAIVTVEDNLPPSITCQVDIAVTAPAGDCSLAVNGIGPATVGDNCGSNQVTYRLEGATTGSGVDDASGTEFNKGITTVWYIITDPFSNADSCSFDVTVQTTVVPLDNASSDPAEVCPGDGSIVLSYSGGVMPEGGIARWYDDAALTNIIGNGNALAVPAPVVTSTYYVRFEGDCDTTSAVSTTVLVKPLTVDPVSAAVDRSDVCAGDGSITLSYLGGDLGSNGAAVWYDGAGFTSSVGTGNNLSLAAPIVTTMYYVRFEADCDTSSAVSIEVNVWPIPEPIFEEKTEIACVNSPLYRYVASGFAGSSFSWNIVGGTIVNDFNDTIYVDWGDQKITGTLELTEVSVNGCVSAPVSIQVEVGGPDLDLGSDLGTCSGTSITITPQGSFASYLWHDGSTAAEYTTDQEGWVVLEVSDANACAIKDSVYVTVWDLPVVDLGPDTSLCGEGDLLLDAGSDGIAYRWSTGEGSQQILVHMGDPEEVRVEVENVYGCIAGDTVLVESCPIEFYFRDIPTAITPGDLNGLNDFWRIDKLAMFSQAVVEIFDRWGTLTWRSEPGYSTPWDGRDMNGREVPMDSYHFVIDLNTGNKKDVVTGIITVIR
jgi:gliding motility-associated-like protein